MSLGGFEPYTYELVFDEDAPRLLQLSVLALVAALQVLQVEQHDLHSCGHPHLLPQDEI